MIYVKRLFKKVHIYFLGLAIIFILTNSINISASEPVHLQISYVTTDYELQKKMEGLHEYIREHFYNPDLNIFYEYINPKEKNGRWSHLPTKEEIAAAKPNPSGWRTGMEDGALNGSAYLAGMIYRYEVTGNPEHAEEVRKIFQGLVLLGTVSNEKGFIARSVLPDGKSSYPASSVDQYTMYVFAMWLYYNSQIASEEEKALIREIIHDICARIEKDDFKILSAKGETVTFGNIGSTYTDRASRLLEVLLAGYHITGEEHWLDIYQNKLKEKDYCRLKNTMLPSVLKKCEAYTVLQNQVSLVTLFELEKKIPIRSAYLCAIKLNADVAEEKLGAYKEYKPKVLPDYYHLGGWRNDQDSLPRNIYREYHHVRVPCESMIIMLLSQNLNLIEPFIGINDQKYAAFLREECLKLLSVYDYTKMESTACLYAEIAYWLAVKQNLIMYK